MQRTPFLSRFRSFLAALLSSSNRSRLNRSRLLSASFSVLTLCVVAFFSLRSFADDPAPSMVITGGDFNATVVGATETGNFDAVINSAPVATAECTLSGPTWQWGASMTSGPEGGSVQASVTHLTGPDGQPLPETSHTVVTLSDFTAEGDYHIKVTAKATYTTNCGTGKIEVNGEKEFTVHVEARKVWDTGTPLTASLVAPTEAKTVKEGGTVHVAATGSDSDHWTKGTQSDNEDDELSYHWTGPGSFDDPNAASTDWHAPDDIGNASASVSYTLKCVVNDKPKAIPLDDGGTRDDKEQDLNVDVTVYQKFWDVGDPLQGGNGITATGGTRSGSTVYLQEGESTQLKMDDVSDSDHWVDGDDQDTDPDDIVYQWTPALSGAYGAVSGTDSQMLTYQAPTALPAGDAYFTTTFTCTANDAPKDIQDPEGGNRNDSLGKQQTITVCVLRKEWSADPAIGHHPALNGEGQVQKPIRWVEDGALTSPADNSVVAPGATVACAVAEAHDYDTWAEAFNFDSDIAQDTVTYTWSTNIGGFLSGTNEDGTPNVVANVTGRTATWVAPSNPSSTETAHIKCTLDDGAGGAVDRPKEGGSRDDAPVDRTVSVIVKKPMWSPTDKEIGYHPAKDENGQTITPTQWVADGQLTAPAADTIVGPDEHVGCSIDEAQDWDTLTDASGEHIAQDATLTYTWTASAGHFLVTHEDESTTLETSASGRNATWVAPSDVTQETNVTVKCTIDDGVGDRVSAPAGGSHDDDAVERTMTLKVRPSVWSPLDKGIGYHPLRDENNQIVTTTSQEDGRTVTHYTWVEDGRMLAPIDQTVTTPDDYQAVAPGAEVPCEVEAAQDWDTLTTAHAISAAKDAPVDALGDTPASLLTYTWTATAGHFKITHEDGSITEADSVSGTDTTRATWVAPDDVTQTTTVTLKCTIDDPSGDRVTAPEIGSHDDQVLVRTATVKVMLPSVTFGGELIENGSLRSCAGGLDDHDDSDPNPDASKRNDLQFRIHTRKVSLTYSLDGHPMKDATLTLQFDGNKGHNYGDNRPDDQVKFARLHIAHKPGENPDPTEVFDDAHWTKTLNVTTDEDGTVWVWVKSSDVICQPKLQAVQKFSPDRDAVKLGEISCDFAEAVSLRRGPNEFDPNETEDTGWVFNFPVLSQAGDTTPAKLFMKFQLRDPDQDGNWAYVNHHKLLIRVSKVTLDDGSVIIGRPDVLKYYAFISSANMPYATTQLVETGLTKDQHGQYDGSAQVVVQVGQGFSNVVSVELTAESRTQWGN